MRSIRARLVLGLLASLIIAQTFIYVLIYARIEDEIDDLFDSELQRNALSAEADGPRTNTPLPDRHVQNPHQDMVVAVLHDHETPSGDAPTPFAGMVPAPSPGFSKRMVNDGQWRLYTVVAGDRRIVAAQPANVRNIAARQITLRAIGPSLAVLPLGALMIGIAIHFGLRPLARITDDLRRRSHRDPAPIDVAELPPDLLPVAQALNELMQRLSETINTQRSFIANAAHELLTPLTALKLQAQMLARSKSADRRQEAMGELQGGIARTLKLAQGLLTLARHDSEGDLHYGGSFDLAATALDSLSIHAPLIEEKHLRVQTQPLAETWVRGNAEAVSTLCSTLIENAVKYSIRGGRLSLSIHQDRMRAELRIEDSGPGIPVEDRERVFDRFYRRRDALASGNGLGLAIAREIAARCDATIRLSESEDFGGLKASVYFAGAPKIERASIDTALAGS